MRDQLLYDYIMSLIPGPYIWGAQHPSRGWDCSGFVIEVLKSAGVVPHKYDDTAQGLFDRLERVGGSFPGVCSFGAVVFYGKSQTSVTHVEFGMDPYRVAGYRGGDSSTFTTAEAIARGAFGGIRPVDYRSDRVAIIKPSYVEIGSMRL